MKLKYYLRGLGIGILITTLILALTSIGKGSQLSDEEIIERAEELGMVMANTKGGDQNSSDDMGNGLLPDGTAADAGGDTLDPDSDAVNADGTTPDTDGASTDTDGTAAGEPGVSDDDQETDTGNRVYHTITVRSGEFSDRISQKLFEAGVVDDAQRFNQYLVDNGIDGLVTVGDHMIPVDASYEEVAGILCGIPENTGENQ